MTVDAPPPPGTSALPDLPGAVELLERALGHTRLALAGVRPAHLAASTPCARWDLDDLLWHMDDALDAFIQAASGPVDVAPSSPLAPRASGASGVAARLGRLQTKACALLGAWAACAAGPVSVGDRPVEARLLVGAAALEITVHGWDVAQATGEGRRIPADLASGLRPVAAALVVTSGRGAQFGSAVAAPPVAPPDVLLLAHLGRSSRVAGAA